VYYLFNYLLMVPCDHFVLAQRKEMHVCRARSPEDIFVDVARVRKSVV
jgi:hypothetical protein